MIRISITEVALVAIAKTLPERTVLQVDRRRGNASSTSRRGWPTGWERCAGRGRATRT
jgi:hypothetical protein